LVQFVGLFGKIMTIFIFGEAMLEYHSKGGASGLRYGGDTLNTAIHLARAGLDVAYVTALGNDPISDALVQAWTDEGINTAFILRHPSRTVGMYAIHVDDRGERSFTYWRDQSAARDMFALPQMAATMEAAQGASLLYFSLISLAILPSDAQDKLIDLAYKVRKNGGQTAYDSNFRPALWPSLNVAREVSTRAIANASMGLPTDVDECQLRDDTLSPQAIASLWQDTGCETVVVKAGEHGCFVQEDRQTLVHFPANQVPVVDTSGAGDAFNGGYQAARLKGRPIAEAIAQGQTLARWVIGRKGAVPEVEPQERALIYP
jgi:2-dehydro-3-deoxygluconokinase